MATLASAAPGEQSAALRLAIVLLKTFGAIGVGFVSVRLKFLEPGKGDMKAIGFFVGKIAFPLLIFKTVATANIGELEWGVILACNISKVLAYAAAFGLSYMINTGEGRLLTATVYAFFVVASNDFAVGFPVIDALYPVEKYPEDLSTYLAINALLFSAVFIPFTLVLFGIGANQGSGGMDRHAVAEILKNIFTNPVMVCTLLGFLWQLVWPGDPADGLPLGFGDMVDLATSPFVMLALFLTGASLKSVNLSTQPIILVLLKVMFCAILGTFIAQKMVPESNKSKDIFVNFSYLYGSIPTSSAPLIFAQQFSPRHSEMVATAIILGLLVSGPIMFLSSVLFDFGEAQLSAAVAEVFDFTVILSAAAGGMLLLTFAAGWRWFMSAPMDIVVFYGLACILYTVSALNLGLGEQCRAPESELHQLWNPDTAGFFLPSGKAMFFSICQQWCRSQGLLIIFWRARGFPATGTKLATLVALLFAVCAGSVTPPNTFSEICQLPILFNWRSPSLALVYLVVVLMLFLVPTVVPSVRRLSGRILENPWEETHGHQRAHGFFSSGLSAQEHPPRLPTSVRVIAVSMLARGLIQVLVGFVLADAGSSDEARSVPSFKQAVIIEMLLEHSQALILVMMVGMGWEFSPFSERLHYGDDKREPEMDRATALAHDVAIQERVHSIAKPQQYMCRTYAECVTGKDLVQVIVDAGRAKNRPDAVKVAQALLDYHFATQVDGHNDMFHDTDDAFYYLAHQDHGEAKAIKSLAKRGSFMRRAYSAMRGGLDHDPNSDKVVSMDSEASVVDASLQPIS